MGSRVLIPPLLNFVKKFHICGVFELLKDIMLLKFAMKRLQGPQMSPKSILVPQGGIKVLINVHTMNMLVFAMDLFEKIAAESFKTLRITRIYNKNQRRNIDSMDATFPPLGQTISIIN